MIDFLNNKQVNNCKLSFCFNFVIINNRDCQGIADKIIDEIIRKLFQRLNNFL